MKYIKKFESFGSKKYWRLPIDNILVALDKIGYPEEDQKELLIQYNSDLNDGWSKDIRKDFIYAGYDVETNSDTNWYYNIDNEQDEYFVTRRYKKQPDIEITQKDIEDWEVKNSAIKYNI